MSALQRFGRTQRKQVQGGVSLSNPAPRSLSLLAVVLFLVTLFAAHLQSAEVPPEVSSQPIPADVRTAFQDRQYADAVGALQKLIDDEKEPLDTYLYLKGLAHFYDKDHDAAIATLTELERSHPQSPWLHKARFTRAEAHLARRDYAAAEEVFSAEAQRLMAAGRKDELAQTLITIADRLATPKDESKPDSAEPDYARAYKLYRAALDLEVGRSLRDQVTYKLARTQASSQNWNQAIDDLQTYLREFDPGWRDGKPTEQAPGAHVHQARFDLGHALQKAGRQDQARRTWQDLSAVLEGKQELAQLRAEAVYRIASTYAIDDPDQALLAVKALRDFLAAYPGDDHAVQAAFDVAGFYQGIGRHEDASSAYREFLKGTGFRAESEEAKELLQELTTEAKFRLGQVLLAQKKYDEAKATWSGYIADHPTGPHWSQCQQGIVEADYRVGADFKALKEYEEARAAWEGFLKRYPLDPRCKQIMYDFGWMSYQAAEDLDGDDTNTETAKATLYRTATDAWRKLVSKYPQSEESSRAQYMIGLIYETKLRDLEKAIEEYRACTWGSCRGPAAARILQMTERQLTLLTERTLRTGEPATVKVQLRNIEKLTVHAYRLDLEDYFRKMHSTGGVEQLDTHLLSADHTYEVPVQDFAKYKPIEQTIEIPSDDGKPGAWAVRVTGGQLQATTLLLRSDLDVIVKSSRKALLVFGQDMTREKPWAGVSVIVSDGNKILFEGKTGPDGVFTKTAEELKSAGQVSVLAVVDGHFASNALQIGRLGLSRGLSPKGYVYTDRPAYRPGQTVHVRGILREVAEGSYAFEEGRTYTLDLVDSQGRVLASEKLALSEFGTLAHQVELDRFAPTGTYSLRVHRPNGPTFSGSFEVQEYKLERMELAFELPQRILFRGELLGGKLVARYYYGEPLTGREVEYFLPDGRRHLATTDEKGEIPFTFDTTALDEEQLLTLRANLVGENVSTQATALLAIRAYSASVSSLRDVYLAGEPFDVTVRAADVEGKPVGRELTLKVLKRESAPDGTWAEVLVSEKPVTTDEKTGQGTASVTLEEGGHHILRAEGTDRFENPITAQAGVFVSDAEDEVKLRILTDRQHFKVGEAPTVVLHSRLRPALALLTFEGEEIISYKVLKLAEGKNPLDVPVGHEHFPNFALGVAAMVGSKFYTATQSFTVERELKVTVTPEKESYAPGEDASVAILTTDQNGTPVAAELSLALVDESLLGLFADRVPDVRQFFEEGARRVAAMATTTSCTFTYRPRTRPVPEALISEEERLERDRLAAERRDLVSDEARRLAETARVRYRAAYQRELGQLAVGYDVQVDSEYRGPEFDLEGGEAGGGFDYAGVSESIESPVDGKVLSRKREELASRRGGRASVSVGGRVIDMNGDALLLTDEITALASAEVPAGGPAAVVRKAFPETAYWNPAVVTDKEGKAALTITMPASTTRWRFVARGTTRETLVGQQTASVVTKKDFFVELKLPAVLGEGDTVRIPARVHNLTDYEGPAELTLTLAAGEKKTVLTATVKLDGRGVAEHVFEGWEVPDVEELTAQLTARASGRSDALSRVLPVRPWGLEFADSRSGLVSERATFELALPEGRSYSRRTLRILIDPGLEQSLVDLALDRRPVLLERSCRPVPTQADTASHLLGVVSVMGYLQALDRKEAPDYKLLSSRAEGLIATLVVTQTDTGGWAWAGSRQQSPDPYTSSRALWALGRARELGLAVPDDTLAKATAYLTQAFSQAAQNDNELKATLLHALAVVGAADFGYANRLYRLRQSLSPAALAHTALALALLDRTSMAAEVLDVLEGKRQPLTGAGRAGQSRWPVDANQAWMRSDDEMTALVLLVYQRVSPQAPAAGQAAEYLLDHQPWSPARARGPALAALALWFGKTKPATADYRLTVLVNQKEVKTLTMRGDAAGEVVEVPTELLAEGKNRVDLVLAGRGKPHYLALLTGFSKDLKPQADAGRRFRVHHRYYKAPAPEYKGKAVQVGFRIIARGPYSSYVNKVSQLPVGSVTNVEVYVDRTYYSDRPGSEDDYLIVREQLPAGTTVLEGSVAGPFDYYRLGDGELTFYVGSRRHIGGLNYTLVGYLPGSYRVLPTVVESVYARGSMVLGTEASLTVLDRGENSDDPYKPTPDELYNLGKAHFDDGGLAEAEPLLEKLASEWGEKLQDKAYRETARMLLFTSIEKKDAKRIVRYFEVMKEKYPDLVIPFDKVLAVAQAYREMEEYERAVLVLSGTLAASFDKDVAVAGVLQEEGQLLASIDLVRQLWRSYPDTPTVTEAFLTLADTLLTTAPKVQEVSELKEKKVTHDDLVLDAIRILVQYLTLYPESPTADDAALNLLTAYLELEDFQSTATLATALAERFGDSPLLDSFEYVEAVARWNLGQYDQAIRLATKVADTVYTLPDGTRKPSDNKDLALYIVGQIWHARGRPAQAIEFYTKVKDHFADAAEAIDYFQRKALALEEVTTFEPGEDVSLTVKYRNIPDLHLLIYRVDLMTLYLTEKNLSRITQVKLAGIRPALEPMTVKLGDGKDYADEEKSVRLKLKESGAYLVICRGEELHTSGMVLVTPLELEVQEDAESGRARVNVTDRKTGEYLEDVHVKVIGSANADFVSGDTDLRGVFLADGLRGSATVIARDNDGQFAFYRGTQSLGRPPEEDKRVQAERRTAQQADFFSNVSAFNDMRQQSRLEQQRQRFDRGGRKGVQVEQMMH